MKVTRRDVDAWLAGIQRRIHSIITGPPGERAARLGVLEARIQQLRDQIMPPRG